MSNAVDNLIAFKILYMLVTPFEKTQAFKMGVIDKDGKVLVKIKDQTHEQKQAYDLLDRLVFSLKNLLGKLPGGKSQIASLAAAYYLVKESYENGLPINEQRAKNIFNLIDEGIILVEEQLMIEEFLEVMEEMGAGAVAGGGEMPTNTIANRTGASVSTDQPVVPKKRKRKFGMFDVPDHIFRRFSKGKKKFSKWSEYLDLEDEDQNRVYQFAKRNPRGVLVLKSGEQTKAIRYNKNGGGNWHKLQRKTKAKLQEELCVEEL